MRLFASVTLMLLCLAAGPGAFAQQKATVADFAGPWVGRSEAGSDRERATTLLIEPAAEGAFQITWASFEADPPGSGHVTARERKLTFRPSKAPGIWLANPSSDPFDTLAAWAEIEGRTLNVSTVALRPDGRLERQSYKRTLTQDGLALSYRRWLDQDLDREIDAEFLKLISRPGDKRG